MNTYICTHSQTHIGTSYTPHVHERVSHMCPRAYQTLSCSWGCQLPDTSSPATCRLRGLQWPEKALRQIVAGICGWKLPGSVCKGGECGQGSHSICTDVHMGDTPEGTNTLSDRVTQGYKHAPSNVPSQCLDFCLFTLPPIYTKAPLCI